MPKTSRYFVITVYRRKVRFYVLKEYLAPLRIYYGSRYTKVRRWKPGKTPRVYMTSYCNVNNTASFMELFVHPLCCTLSLSPSPSSLESNLDTASSENKCLFEGFHAFPGSLVWENWHVERNMRFRIIIMSAVKLVYASSRARRPFFPPTRL